MKIMDQFKPKRVQSLYYFEHYELNENVWFQKYLGHPTYFCYTNKDQGLFNKRFDTYEELETFIVNS